MLLDLIVGVAASLIASGLVGFFGNKAISKQNSVTLKVYVFFLAIVVFVVTAMLSVILNKDFTAYISSISEANLLRFYQNCINSFVSILLFVAGISAMIIGIEAWDRGERREHRQSMDRYKTMK